MQKTDCFSGKYGSISRRSFMKMSGLLGLSLASAGIIPAAAEAVKFNRKSYKVSRTELTMGTFVTMTLIHASKDNAEEAMGRAFEEIDRLTRCMNRFDETTAIAELNSQGVLKDVPPEVLKVVTRALYFHKLSGGAFDISVKPVVDLFRKKFGGAQKEFPTKIELARALELVGSDKIELKGQTIRFKKSGMGITLDGIAKGYIVDKASKILSDYQIKNHLINAGGDIRARGVKDTKPWTVAIQDPRKKKEYPDVIHIAEGAVATSGNYEIYFDHEKMVHHIIDPRTGLSPNLSTSVSVLADTAMDADALSTSVFVMEPANGVRFIDSVPDCECLVIAKRGKKIKSAGWKSAAI
jgi:thiamine biosynthesis lipoprotein